MSKYGASEKTHLTKESVEKAIDSFKDLSKRLKSDYAACIDLAKQLSAFNKDQNFDNFYRQFEPKQNEVNKLAEQMDRQIAFVEKVKDVLIVYLEEGKETI